MFTNTITQLEGIKAYLNMLARIVHVVMEAVKLVNPIMITLK